MRKKKTNYKKKNQNRKLRVDQKNPVRKRWIARKKTFSDNPYVITISLYRRNLFFTAADLEGKIKFWINSGRCGFKGRDKTNKMAIWTVANIFFKKVCRYGIKEAIFKFKNFNKKRWQLQKVIRKFYWRRRLKLIGFFVETQISFNGCRKKKKRRK